MNIAQETNTCMRVVQFDYSSVHVTNIPYIKNQQRWSKRSMMILCVPIDSINSLLSTQLILV